jgi:hypothetical protein
MTWRRLQSRERAFFRAALWYSKSPRIVNETVVAKLSGLLEKLQETRGVRILNVVDGRGSKEKRDFRTGDFYILLAYLLDGNENDSG